MENTVFVKTLGCDKNTVDSEVLIGTLLKHTYKLVNDPEDAKIIIVNTCCFIEDAKNESIDTIFTYLPYRMEGNCKSFIVAGCMAQRYAHELRDEIPEIDHFLGVNALDDVLEIAENQLERETRAEKEERIYKEYRDERYLQKGTYTAFLKISEGCDKYCTYCVIPQIRGRYRSREISAILEEAAYLRSNGVTELILIAQDLTQYGSDLKDKSSLAQLLDQIASTIDFQWIRLMYMYPEGISRDLLEVMKKHDKICNYLDMPIQHTEDSVLKAMGRQINKKTIFDKISMIRNILPDVVLRTTIITGFPGETQESFNNMLETLDELKFERLGAFRYSQEEGTPAASFPNQIDEREKERRRAMVYGQQEEITANINKSLVGDTILVLVEDLDDGIYQGRTYGDAPDIDCAVLIDHDDLEIGQFYPVKITQSMGFDLIGELNNEFTK